jgi:hypothetical protein
MMNMKIVNILLPAAIILVILGMTISVPAQTITATQQQVYSQPTVNDMEPNPGQKWAVTDGLGIFSFFMTTQGDVQYQSGYPFPPSPYSSPITTFLNHTYTSFLLTTNPFTLTQGVFYSPFCPPEQNQPPQHQCLGPSFIFDAVWVSGTNRISIIELTDPLYTDSHGLRYFIPGYMFNQTLGVYSVQTDGRPDRLTAINLPSGDALIGDSEYLPNGNFQATVYHYFRGVNCASVAQLSSCQLPTFTKVASWTGGQFYSVQPEYLAPYAYYVLGNNAMVNGNGTNYLSIYRATSNQAWVPNATLNRIVTNQTLYANKFTIATDSARLYVGGEYGLGSTNATFFVVSTNGTVASWRSLYLAESALNITQGGAFSGPHNDVFMSTHYGTVGVHFYFDYESASAKNATYMAVLYSVDQALTWSMSPTMPLGPTCLTPGCYPPPTLSGMARTPFNYNPEVDYLLLAGKFQGLGKTYSYVDNYLVTLPSIVQIVTASTSTNFIFAIDTDHPVTVTASGPAPIVSDLLTPGIMMVIVALPAGIFAIAGRYMGGGRFGVILMMVGTGVGVFAGVFYKLYPYWAIIIVLMAIVAAALFSRQSTVGEVQPQ